jgi:thioredoxin reductase (NADPH)
MWPIPSGARGSTWPPASGCQAGLAAERRLTHHDLAGDREPLTRSIRCRPANPVPTATSDEANYDPSALWRKGSYAWRKLYHDCERPSPVVYSSPSCGPCHVLKPQLKRVLQDFAGAAQGVEIDIEADQAIAEQAGVTGTPTVQLFFRKGSNSSSRA